MAQLGIAWNWRDSKGKSNPWIETGGAQSQAYKPPRHGITPVRDTYKPPAQPKIDNTPRLTYESPSGIGGTGENLQNWMAMIQGMMPQQQSYQMPTVPQEPIVTQSMIAEWQKRAMEEAGLNYDPQILAIQQELNKAVLAAQQTKAGIAPSYQEVLSNIAKWQEETTKAEQGRAYARGFGQGGGLMQTETDVAKEALKQQTGALTEKARREGDIDMPKYNC